MQHIFESINGIFSFVGPLSDFLWDFPTNFEWYSSIPVLGNFSFEIIEECTKSQLNDREDYWQDFFKAKEFGYSIK